MPYNAKVAKPAYYKQPVKTFAQLQKNIIRLQMDMRMGSCTKQKVIASMFNSYKTHCNVK